MNCRGQHLDISLFHLHQVEHVNSNNPYLNTPALSSGLAPTIQVKTDMNGLLWTIKRIFTVFSLRGMEETSALLAVTCLHLWS